MTIYNARLVKNYYINITITIGVEIHLTDTVLEFS